MNIHIVVFAESTSLIACGSRQEAIKWLRLDEEAMVYELDESTFGPLSSSSFDPVFGVPAREAGVTFGLAQLEEEQVRKQTT